MTWVGLVIQGAEGIHPIGRGVQLYGMRRMGETRAEGGPSQAWPEEISAERQKAGKPG